MFKSRRSSDPGGSNKNSQRLKNLNSSGSSEQSDEEDQGSSQSLQPISETKRDFNFLQLSPRHKFYTQQRSLPLSNYYNEEYPGKIRTRRSHSLPLLDRVTLGIFTIPEDKATGSMKRLKFHQSEDCSLEAIVEENNDNGSNVRFKHNTLSTRKWELK